MMVNTKKLSMVISIALITLILSSFIASFHVKAEESNVLEVNQNGSYNYTSIQEAIHDAKEGDIVEVIGTHPSSKKEIPMAIKALGLKLIDIEEKDGVWKIRIQR